MAYNLDIQKEKVLSKGLFRLVVYNGTLDGNHVAMKCVSRYSLCEEPGKSMAVS